MSLPPPWERQSIGCVGGFLKERDLRWRLCSDRLPTRDDSPIRFVLEAYIRVGMMAHSSSGSFLAFPRK